MMKLRQLIILAVAYLIAGTSSAQSVRETIRLDEGWKFALGNASDPAKDFGCGTEYFNYLTKANSLHNEGLIQLTATADGLKENNLTLTAQ